MKIKEKQELLAIYSAYFPYKLEIMVQGFNDKKILSGIGFDDHSVYFDKEDNWCTITMSQPILRSMENLTKEELSAAGFQDHIDYLTHERLALIERNGLENYINKIPFGHVKFLLENQYNIFGLEETEFINIEKLKEDENN